MKDVASFEIASSRTKKNFNAFFRQCIVLNIELGNIKTENLVNSSDLTDFLKTGANGILAFEYESKDGETTFFTCDDTVDIIYDLREEARNLGIKSFVLKDKSNNLVEETMKFATGNNSLEQAKILEQAMLSNAVASATQDYVGITGATAGAINYSTTASDMTKQNSALMGITQATKYLPLLRIVIESIFYSIFPLIVLMAMLPNGFAIFKNYIMILVTLQLWSPLFAVFHLIMMGELL